MQKKNNDPESAVPPRRRAQRLQTRRGHPSILLGGLGGYGLVAQHSPHPELQEECPRKPPSRNPRPALHRLLFPCPPLLCSVSFFCSSSWGAHALVE